MLSSFTAGRTAVFIDAANIFYSQRTLGWLVDYAKLMAYFERETTLAFVRFYSARVSTDEKQERFIRKLEGFGYSVRAKELKRIRTGKDRYIQKGNLDIELVIDALNCADEYETCVLMSGDSDFAPLLDALKLRGKLVIVLSSKHHVAHELLVRAKYVNLQHLRSEVAYEIIPPGREAGREE